jgi:Na+-transporting NADH:ubiquinone oxidoreductase subunit NqrE
MTREAIIETIKSFLRFMYFGVLGLIGTFLTSLLANEDLINTVVNIGGVYLPVGAVIVAVITGVIKLIDRYVHTNKKYERNGIAPKVLQG